MEGLLSSPTTQLGDPVMTKRNWLLTIPVSIFLVIPGVTLAQTNTRIGPIAIPRNERVSLINVLPRNANEYEIIYGRRPTRIERIDMAKTRLRLGQTNQPRLELYPGARSSVGFDDYVRQAEEQTIMLVGHNVNGEFRFANGVSRNLAEIESFLEEQNKQAIILSCDAQNYVKQFPAPRRPLTNQGALRMVKSISSIGRDTSFTEDSFGFGNNIMNRAQADIYGIERLTLIESIVKPSVAIGGIIATGGTVYMIEHRRRNKKR